MMYRRISWLRCAAVSALALGVAACSDDGGDGGANGDAGDTNGDGGTNGATNGGGTTDGGGTTNGGGGDGSTAASQECMDYCDAMEATCTGDNAQYDNRDACLTACSGFDTSGTEGDASGDTLQCRMTHVGFAKDMSAPDVHCPHAGPTGGGVCVGS